MWYPLSVYKRPFYQVVESNRNESKYIESHFGYRSISLVSDLWLVVWLSFNTSASNWKTRLRDDPGLAGVLNPTHSFYMTVQCKVGLCFKAFWGGIYWGIDYGDHILLPTYRKKADNSERIHFRSQIVLLHEAASELLQVQLQTDSNCRYYWKQCRKSHPWRAAAAAAAADYTPLVNSVRDAKVNKAHDGHHNWAIKRRQ